MKNRGATIDIHWRDEFSECDVGQRVSVAGQEGIYAGPESILSHCCNITSQIVVYEEKGKLMKMQVHASSRPERPSKKRALRLWAAHEEVHGSDRKYGFYKGLLSAR